ncbi:MAG TPA: NADH-quinone oxidoreductase subunit N, partial [Roseiarcus sp.]|nr:NADH-quinone oxidoreductase subunit N [Roseiarcus sp.]
MTTALSLPLVLPEALLALGALALLLLGAWRGEKSGWIILEAAVGVIGVALLTVIFNKHVVGATFYGAFID